MHKFPAQKSAVFLSEIPLEIRVRVETQGMESMRYVARILMHGVKLDTIREDAKKALSVITTPRTHELLAGMILACDYIDG